MAKVIGVQFQKNGKVYYYDPAAFSPKTGEYVIVETERGIDLAEVVLDNFAFEPAENEPPLKKMIRSATDADILCATENRMKEQEAFQVCQRKIQEHQLEMKLVSVEYAFDGSKVLFYFTANGRVDFRSLVKDLASVFKTRIELRQIGVRDEARMLGGLGPCGRPICCKAFLNDFQPVSIKMAKEQNLSLNPTKISGVCGRLMCCLKYEQDQYEAVRKKMPRMGREIATPDGHGTVTELNVVKETVSVRITNGDSSEIKTYSLEDIIAARGGEQRENEPSKKRAEAAEQRVKEKEDSLAEAAEESDGSVSEEEYVEEAAPESETMNEQPRNRGKQPRNRSLNKGEGERRDEGERAEKSERRLGQPVRRENPKKNRPETSGETGKERKKPGFPEGQEKPAITEKRGREEAVRPPEPAPEGKKEKPKTSWADQLQKAMAAIERDSNAGNP